MVFISHETYTPARGGSAAAEINALRYVFKEAAPNIIISNTKGFTGHAMGAGIEDYELLRLVAEKDEKLADEICSQLVRTFTDYDATVKGFERAHLQLLEAASRD